jgi:transcriptional regulator with XRE-family HTH domain
VVNDISQKDFAETIGVSRSHLSQIETGDRDVAITVDLLLKYSHALDIPVSSLMFFAESGEGIKADLKKFVQNMILDAMSKAVLKTIGKEVCNGVESSSQQQ